MKLDSYNSDVFDLAAEELKCSKTEAEEFWKDMENLFRYGLPHSDTKGHSTEFRFRVRPIQGDIVAAIKEKMPEGWFKSQGNLYRCLLAAGCKSVLRLLSMEKSEWGELMRDLNTIARRARIDEFKKEMASLKGNIANGSMPPQERSKIIDLVSRIEQKIVEL
jgi:hypothetical protein